MMPNFQRPAEPSRYGFLKTFLAYFLPLQVVLLILLAYYFLFDLKLQKTVLAKRESAQVELQKKLISSEFKGVIRDLLYLAANQTLTRYLDQETPALRQTVAQDFAQFCQVQGIYDRVRYLDADGMEVIRINFIQGRMHIVPPDRLQSEAQRYYFLAAIKLAQGEVYVSPFDLNIEGHEVERPLKPVIRFATPVFDRQGRKRGVLILNYLGQTLIDILKEARTSAQGQLMLLNAKGYWLHSPNPQEEWGFMFPDKHEVTFGQAYPQAWRTIAVSGYGQIETAKGIFIYETIYPLRDGRLTSETPLEAKGPADGELDSQNYKWKIVSFIPSASWRQRSHDLLKQLSLLYLPLSLLLVTGSWLLARARLSRRQAEASVQIERDKMRNILDTMPVGICIITQDHGIEYTNPLLEKTFGAVAGRQCFEYFLEPGADCSWFRDQSSLEGQLLRQEWFSTKTGKTYDLLLTSFPDAAARPATLLIFHDITERRRTESALREMTIVQQAILDSANYSIISTTPEGIITTFNTAAERWLGYAAAEVVGQTTPAILHDPGEVKARAAELSQELGVPVEPGFEVFVAKARRGGPDEREWSYLRKDGSRFPVLLSVTALRHEDGQITGFLGIASDITERKRAQEAVNRLAAIVEFTNDAIIGKTLDGVIISWNQGAEHIYGYTEAEVLGRHISLLVPPDRQDELAGIFAGIRQGQRVQNYETVRIRKDGRLIDVSLTVSPIRDAEGVITGISTIARDITTRKQAEMQLRKLSMAVEQSPASVVITDTQGIIEYVNPKFTQITGYRVEEAIGQNPRILKSGDKSPEEYRDLWETITSGQEWRGIFHNRKKNGDLYWESASISPIKDAQGRITHFIAVKEDITAMKEAQEHLVTLSLVASKTDNAVIITDKFGVTEWVNDGFTRLTGFTLDEVVGKKPGAVLQGPASDPDTIKLMSAQLGARQPLTAEIINYHKTGRPYWVAMDITPIFDDKGELTRFISIERDITQRKEIEEKLQQAKAAADAANRAKSDFLASMSHEIRTPMNAIIGMADLLWETPLTPEQQQYVEVFRTAGETLLNLINGILDLSKVEAGQITLESIDFDLAEIVEKVCEVMALKAHQKELELACRLMPEVPTQLVGDPVRVRQILTNLVGNAVKFTEAGEVLVEVKITSEDQCPEDPADRCRITFSIKDTGIGISPDKLGVIFDKFTQADNSTTRKYGGTGLGLAISKHLVELMGGKLQVQSQA
jgi:PAS domain S-box-containing protein